ncbi:hypothetical protein F4679DRAFT_536464 [Xylaria curta]|nr:hypothetical protein F4679DRAFT_536464 [Xylaria curta]
MAITTIEVPTACGLTTCGIHSVLLAWQQRRGVCMYLFILYVHSVNLPIMPSPRFLVTILLESFHYCQGGGISYFLFYFCFHISLFQSPLSRHNSKTHGSFHCRLSARF